ncbi:MAG TPA: IPT/TIG domain-containing protein [Solirubrobacteraceae bacterium]|nr:IPT/TIG domain-containing protein [Solirubrobacteraceae bacterium]
MSNVATDHARMRKLSRRATLVLGIAAALLLALASARASAIVVRLHNGHRISYRPLSGQRPAASRTMQRRVHNLEYHGGPVMTSNTNHAFYWDPSGAPSYPAEYQTGINRYFEDLAHDSGGVQNVDSIATQYGDSGGAFANYNSKFGGAIVDKDPYPPDGCTAAAICLTDQQLQAELTAYIEAHKLPHGLTDEYFLLTPPGVENCGEATSFECSAGSSSPVYCAYHSFISFPGGSIIYAVDAFVAGNPGCDNGEHPNGNASDAALQGGISHEHNESITDPEINAWYASNGEENGDKCRTFNEATEYGPALGTAGDGSRYNQVINGHFYWYQQEWSNEGSRCEQRLTPEVPFVKRIAPRKGSTAGGTTVTLTGSAFKGVTAVRFGAVNAASFTVLSPTTIQAVSPAEPKGSVLITVQNAVGSSTPTGKDRFKYR